MSVEYPNSRLQALFDKMVLGLMEQGKRSWNSHNGICAYRAPDGCKCIIGQLIDDPDVAYKMDNCEVLSLSSIWSDTPKIVPADVRDFIKLSSIEFANMLQYTHDSLRGDLDATAFRMRLMLGLSQIISVPCFAVYKLTIPNLSKWNM